MRAPSLLAALAVTVALLLAGCGAKTTSTTTSGHPGTTTPCPAAAAGCAPATTTTAAAGAHKPVHIQDSGDLTQGADKKYNWTIDPGFTKAHFEFKLVGAQDAPEYFASNLNYKLQDPTGKSQADGSSGMVGASTGASGCVACKDLQGPTGAWLFSFAAGPSAATYSVTVDVTY